MSEEATKHKCIRCGKESEGKVVPNSRLDRLICMDCFWKRVSENLNKPPKDE